MPHRREIGLIIKDIVETYENASRPTEPVRKIFETRSSIMIVLDHVLQHLVQTPMAP